MRVGMVGRVTRTKGQHLLLHALGTLPQRIKERIGLVFVGGPEPGSPADASYRDELCRLTRAFELEDQVHWAGFQEDPVPWYRSLDVLAHPSPAEPMGLVLLEALQQGVPVLAARGGGIPEIVEEGVNSFLVAPDDEGALGQALTLLLEDSKLRGQLKAGARAGPGERFSQETFGRNISGVILEVCEAGDRKRLHPERTPEAWNP
jgi:glycosyltransferase involved in cell wall biosynthesis